MSVTIENDLDITNSNKGCLHLSSFSSAMMLSTKNKVLDRANSLPIILIQLNKRLPGSIGMMRGSVQNHSRILYVLLCFNVGQIIIMKSK